MDEVWVGIHVHRPLLREAPLLKFMAALFEGYIMKLRQGNDPLVKQNMFGSGPGLHPTQESMNFEQL